MLVRDVSPPDMWTRGRSFFASLQQRPYLAGVRFTVADVCVASVLAWVKDSEKLMDSCVHIQEWLQRCMARPAFQQLSLMP